MQLLRWLSWTGWHFDSSAYASSQAVLGFPTPEPSHLSPRANYAAIVPSLGAQVEVVKAPFPQVGDRELVIKNHVVAVNPVDWKIQDNHGVGAELQYPLVLGEDVAGEVVEVGSKIKHQFHVGQRVIAFPLGLANGPAYGGFQLYPVVNAATVSVIPDDLTYVAAAALPLSISTAAAGLFVNTSLGLAYPSRDSASTPSCSKGQDAPPIVLVWGGSSSVGTSAIQLATAAGYEVLTTASEANFDLCKHLGATHVLDYHRPDVVDSLVRLSEGRRLAGAFDSIGSFETTRQLAAVLQRSGGGKVASVGRVPDDLPSDVTATAFTSAAIVEQEPEVAQAIWGEYVPWALESGKLVASPKPLVVGRGLGAVQKGIDRQRQGVSARKVEIIL